MPSDMQLIDIVFGLLDWGLKVLTLIVIPVAYRVAKLLIKVLKSQDLLDQRICALEADTRDLAKSAARLPDEIEKATQHLPTAKDTSELALVIERLGGQVGTTAAILDRLERTVSRHEDFLLNGGGK